MCVYSNADEWYCCLFRIHRDIFDRKAVSDQPETLIRGSSTMEGCTACTSIGPEVKERPFGVSASRWQICGNARVPAALRLEPHVIITEWNLRLVESWLAHRKIRSQFE